jgi:hypothetical protein
VALLITTGSTVVVYPRAHKVSNIVEMVVEVGDGETFINKMVLGMHQYFVDVVRTIEIKSTYEQILL